jgi:histone-lysine N-methyltransferase SUV39H
MLIHLTGQQMKMPYIIFCALKDIPSHTELTFDYDPCSDLDKSTIKKKKGKKRQGKEPLPKGSILCKCGEDECRQWVRVLM